MEKVICVYKDRGQTPLEALDAFRKDNPLYKNAMLSYAGRLDPMAEGLLLVLVNDENKNRAFYQDLTKTYEFSLLFGITTDTFDPLGIVTNISVNTLTPIEHGAVIHHTTSYPKRFEQPYPPYSSFHIKGKPLFYYARNNLLEAITIPTKKVSLSDFKVVSERTITIHELMQELIPIFETLSGDFRQDEIKKSWEYVEKTTPNAHFSLITCTLTVSSGTYIRSIVHDIGKRVGKGALAYTIKRTAIGTYSINDTDMLG